MPDFRKLHRDVVYGRSNGKIIWQPRIGAWFSDKQHMKIPLPAPYTGMSLPELYRSLGCSARLYQYGSCIRRVEDPSVRETEKQLSQTDVEKVIETPVGKQVGVLREVSDCRIKRRLKWPISSEEEMKVAIWREERASWEWDQAQFDRLEQELGDLGATTMNVPRHNIQDLYIGKMGVENAIYALTDYPSTCEAYFRASNGCHRRMIKVINASPLEIINLGDNVHGGTLPPDLFARYLLPVYQEHSALLRVAGKFVCSHWDGDTKPLLRFARQTGLNGIEAITPEPQGDVTLEEVKEALGDDLFLLDGIPAIFFDTMFPLSVLEECAHRVIELFAPRLVLGISDEISSTGDIERIRVVGRIVDEYNKSREAL